MGTYCHPADAVLSDDVKVELKSNRASLYTASLATTLHYFTHRALCRSSLNIIRTVFCDIPSSHDKFRSVSRLSVVNRVFNFILHPRSSTCWLIYHDFHYFPSHNPIFKLPVPLLKH